MLLQKSRKTASEKNEETEPKWNNSKLWMWLMMEIQCCKEKCCIGTWNVRSTNQGKVEVVKQEMARVNVDILGISELKWTGMGEFNSDDCYIYDCGQESLRWNGVVVRVNRRVWNAALDANLKTTESSQFASKANHSVSQWAKSMPQPLMLKKGKLTSAMKSFKTF